MADVIPFARRQADVVDLGERNRRASQGHTRSRRGRARRALFQLALGHPAAIGQDARAFDHVAQFADVAFPGAAHELVFSRGCQAEERFAQAAGGFAHERRHEVGDVFAPLAQRRHGQLHHVDAVIQVAAEPLGGDLGQQIAVGRGQHVHVHPARRGGADALDFAGFEDAQQLGLDAERQLTDLVEEDRTAVGDLEQPGGGFGGAGV